MPIQDDLFAPSTDVATSARPDFPTLVDYLTQVAQAIWPEEPTDKGNVLIHWKFSKLSNRCLHGEDFLQGTG